MFRHNFSIRQKLRLMVLLLLLLLGILAGTGICAVRLYRDSVLFSSHRSRELPVVMSFSSHISQMRVQVVSLKWAVKDRESLLNDSRLRRLYDGSDTVLSGSNNLLRQGLKDSFANNLVMLRNLEKACDQMLRENHEEVSEKRKAEWQILHEIADRIDELELRSDHLDDTGTLDLLGRNLEEMNFGADQLIGNLQLQLNEYTEAMQTQYRWFLGLVCTAAIASGLLLLVFLRLMYAWVFRPLRELVAGSQMVAQGRFNYRIKINAKDEMSQLADAFNRMTERFETVRNELDLQVQTKSRELVRTERLASVGFLAAGVAHEINNPLASIAMSAESLQRRIVPILDRQHGESKNDVPPKISERDIIERYLAMIQEEAFRCKGITEKLLDFARTERKIRERTNLVDLVNDIVEMLGPMGKYRGKHIRLDIPNSLYALVNPQEMKQVTLNLLTNALDSVEENGTVWVRLFEKEGHMHLVFEDDGCGMNSEILQNVFEPFFTKGKNGQGTGLGLSITHRIVSEHQGRIEAYSAGFGRGSVFQVEIPLTSPEAERLAAMKSKEILTSQRRAA